METVPKPPTAQGSLSGPLWILVCVSLAIATFFLWDEHPAHILGETLLRHQLRRVGDDMAGKAAAEVARALHRESEGARHSENDWAWRWPQALEFLLAER